MKTIVRTTLGVALMLMTAGCAAGAAAATTGSTGAATTVAGGAPTIEITDTVRLILGTLKLGEAGLAPDATEAANLIPLWQAYRSLSTSDTTAPEELQALLGQIRQTMTPEQLKAIDGMSLGQEDITSLFQSFRQNGDGSAGGTSGSGSSRDFQPGEGFRPFAGGGDRPPFGAPDGGFVTGGGPFGEGLSGLTPEQLATAQAQRANRAQDSSRAGLFLIGPLIANLQALAGE